MKIRLHNNSAGIALIIVLIAVLVLSALAAGFALSMKVETKLALNANSDTQLSGSAVPAWSIAGGSCRRIRATYDSLNQIWAGGPGDGLRDQRLKSQIPFKLGTAPALARSLTSNATRTSTPPTVPKSSRRSRSWAWTPTTFPLCPIRSRTGSARPARRVSPARKAIIIRDSTRRITPRTRRLTTSPNCCSSRGILDHPEIYWGGCATNNPGPTFQHKLGFGNCARRECGYPFGLKDVFTAISSGRININTAGTNVLAMIPGMNAAMADNLIKLRAGPDGVDGTDDDTPFQDAGQAIQSAGGNPGLAGNFVSTRSSTFMVFITAQIGSAPPRKYTAILHRSSPTDIQVLSFY